MVPTAPAPEDIDWGARALAEIDYGIAVIDAAHHVAYCNPVARRYLEQRRGLQCAGTRLVASERSEQVRLDESLQAVFQRGHKRMLVLGSGERRIGVAAVRVSCDSSGDSSCDSSGDSSGNRQEAAAKDPVPCRIAHRAMLVLSRPSLCEPLSVYAFARDHALSPMEHQVLVALCRGQRTQEIAEIHGGSLHTVRSQITSIRAKTSFDSVSELVQWISTLPPVLRTVECA